MQGVKLGVRSTSFYPNSIPIPGSVNASAGNISQPNVLTQADNSAVGGSGNLPALWWLGIIVVLVALRLAYEYA